MSRGARDDGVRGEVGADGARLVRVVSWNVRWGLHRRSGALAAHEPAIAVIQEARHPRAGPRLDDLVDETAEAEGRLARDADVQVMVADPWQIVDRSSGGPLLARHVAVRLEGPAALSVIGLSARPSGTDARRYLRRVREILERHEPLIAQGRCLVVGDFNVQPRRGERGARGELVELIESLGYVSAYHHAAGEEFGAETRATHHHEPSRSEWHIDLCLVPARWAGAVRRVGIGDECGSDHRPLVVDLAVDALD